MNPTPDDISRDLEDAAQAVDREKVQDRLTPAARQRLVAATGVISDTLALVEAQIDVDELRDENRSLRAEIARLKRTVDENAAALFVRAIKPDSSVTVGRDRGQWRVSIPCDNGLVRVAYSPSLSEAFGNLADNMKGVSF